VQAGHPPRGEPGTLAEIGTLVFRFPRLFAVGQRTPLTLPTPDGDIKPVIWSGSDAFEQQVATFPITPTDAVRIALAAGNDARGAQSIPNFAVGRWYHVATDHVIGQASIGGIYVSGDSGEVITSHDRRVVRFDAFEGDRIVSSRSSPNAPAGAAVAFDNAVATRSIRVRRGG
jgi:hypothetical protein